MGTTPNIGLSTTPENTNKVFKTWRMEMDGEIDSNMTKIDDAIGDLNTAIAGHYVTAGQKSGTTLGTAATAEGICNEASGGAAHAEGSISVASGNDAHAEGVETTASGIASHAEGNETTASGDASHAEGRETTASGDASHAEGRETTASKIGSHAEGYQTSAVGFAAHAEGDGTVANHRAQHVFGRYNVEDPSESGAAHAGNYVEIVGNGTVSGVAPYTRENRSNARTLDWAGNEVLAGKLTLGAGPTGDMDAATKAYVDGTDEPFMPDAWYKNELNCSGNVRAVLGDGTRFLASTDSGEIYYSPDGDLWALSTINGGDQGDDWRAMCSGYGKNVAISYGGKIAVGIQETWTASALPAQMTSGAWRSVAYGGGRYVAVGESGAAIYSTDGTTWTRVSLPGGHVYTSVAFCRTVNSGTSGIFCATASDTTAVAVSSDGAAWTALTCQALDDIGQINAVYGCDTGTTDEGGKLFVFCCPYDVVIADACAVENAASTFDAVETVHGGDRINWQVVAYGGRYLGGSSLRMFLALPGDDSDLPDPEAAAEPFAIAWRKIGSEFWPQSVPPLPSFFSGDPFVCSAYAKGRFVAMTASGEYLILCSGRLKNMGDALREFMGFATTYELESEIEDAIAELAN